jgi:hypothetical protein
MWKRKGVKRMETKKGACRFCGQNKMIEVPNGYTQEEIDEEVTCECKCDEAKAYQEKKEREERLEAQKLSAQGTTFELFHNDFPEVEHILNKTIPLLVTKKVKKLTVNTGTKVTATIGISKGTIKVERTETSKYSRETELE